MVQLGWVALTVARVVHLALHPRARMLVARREAVTDTRVDMDASAQSALAAELLDQIRGQSPMGSDLAENALLERLLSRQTNQPGCADTDRNVWD